MINYYCRNITIVMMELGRNARMGFRGGVA